MTSQNFYPSPEEELIKQEEQNELAGKVDLLIKLTFHRREIFDAWHEFEVLCAPIALIARQQSISWYQAKKRIEVGKDIVINLRKSYHRLEDE